MSNDTNPSPQSDHDWTIHSINIHGAFFERWCRKVIEQTGDWKVKSVNFPVEVGGKESALDIRAELRVNNELLTLLIECKKNNPDFVNWIFFPKVPITVPQHQPVQPRFTLTQTDNEQHSTGRWQTQTRKLYKRPIENIPIADEVRETRGSYQNQPKNDKTKTKTANNAVSEAAHQVALATQAIILEDHNRCFVLAGSGNDVRMPWFRQAFLPAIVTTATLYTCGFDPQDINPATGEIPYNKANLTRQPYLIYEYALPRHLQKLWRALDESDDDPDRFIRMHILVVHSESFAGFLDAHSKQGSLLLG